MGNWGQKARIGALVICGACSTHGERSVERELRHPSSDDGPQCIDKPMYLGDKVRNVADFAGSRFADFYKTYYAPPASAEIARANIARLFKNDCQRINEHLATKPNVYIHFSGFGSAAQDNAQVDEAEVLQWINRRDPGALIFTISWDCQSAVTAGFPWCQQHADAIGITPDHPAMKSLKRVLALVDPADGAKSYSTIARYAAKNQGGYNLALSHALDLSSHLIDQLLAADLGDIRVTGYSMGAHAAADLLVTDFTGTKGEGFKWTAKNVCEDGSSTCRVAKLRKVKWALSMGLPGWSDALRNEYNHFSADGLTARHPADLRVYENGGLLRIRGAYNNKLNVLNHRRDPTSISDDVLQRSLNDQLFAEYNHYGHDYARPAFANAQFVALLDDFVETSAPLDQKEIGILLDAAAFVEFDDCAPGTTCTPRTNYQAHRANRSHRDITPMRSSPIETAPGVGHADRTNNLAAHFVTSSQPLVLRTLDQEDLRGAVEFFYKPDFDPAGTGQHGLFSYGSCEGSNDDLMPRAYVDGGTLYFETNYQGALYQASLKLAGRSDFARGRWTHLSFAWELPTRSLAITGTGKTDDEIKAAVKDRDVQLALENGSIALAVASGLMKAPPTSYRVQQGQGRLRIYVNGRMQASGVLGKADSHRECLKLKTVLNSGNYELGNGTSYPDFNPYSGYLESSNDEVNVPSAGGDLGSLCKGYRIRNTQVFMGCARKAGVTAQGDMDDIWVVFGPGREQFFNVTPDGRARTWPIHSQLKATR
ncbi:MAG: hypothetical protein JST16_05740 [Bdellovibrionales bacterium]|nr:hypothetical protein [Bdellovibrionales bacterium]